MTDARRWQLGSGDPYALQLAADARLSQTDYVDDQSWELLPGIGDGPSLALQTRYGGRVGLASLVPMWLVNEKTVYEAAAYQQAPLVTAFAPGWIRLEAKIKADLWLAAEYFVFDSHVCGALYTLKALGDAPVSVRLDLFAHIAAEGKERKVNILTLEDGTFGLHLGQIGNINPVVYMENGQAEVSEFLASPKIGLALTVPAGGEVRVRWVHVGLVDMRDGLAVARGWLNRDWDMVRERIVLASSALPQIHTGNEGWDAAIAFSYQQLTQAFLRATRDLPYSSFVATRQPGRGFSPRGDGSDHNWQWDGQMPSAAYPVALGIASVDTELAQGVVRNYLASQEEDGWIDMKPGIAGQRQGVMCPPLLARLAWGIFQYTEDAAFLQEVFVPLLRFFERWFSRDLDVDGDGLPEWQAEIQTGYTAIPTFGHGHGWAQGADIRTVESPDLAAYLISEALSLKEIARYLNNSEADAVLTTRLLALQTALESLWKDKHYGYRDRDAHTSQTPTVVIEDNRADQIFASPVTLHVPARLLVRVTGGLAHVPKMTLRLQGVDAAGKKLEETVVAKSFVWQRGWGVYTSQHVYALVTHVSLEGLAGVYRYSVRTIDTSGLDLNALMPLWAVSIPHEHSESLIRLLRDGEQFWRRNGLSMVPTSNPHYDPSNENGSGGVWMFWNTLLGEALIENGQMPMAYDLLKKLLNVQVEVLKQHKAFTEFYHADEPRGLGDRGHIAGLVPVHLLMRVMGVRVVSPGVVWLSGPFVWEKPVTLRQHGVEVALSKEGAQVRFPSGFEAHANLESTWVEIRDPQPMARTIVQPLPAPEVPTPAVLGSGRIDIPVQSEPPETPEP